MAAGGTSEQLLVAYPQITAKESHTCLDYAAAEA
jgi:uncharacterized protein (DUF433 family)